MKLKKKFSIVVYLTCTLAFIECSSSGEDSPIEPTTTKPTTTQTTTDKMETFTFSSNGKSIRGKIFVPKEYETDKNLPAIYLLDFTEQHYPVVTNEFDKVIEGVKSVNGLKAFVVTLEELMDIDLVLPRDFQEYYDVYKNMASYVNDHYTGNNSRTFIAKGSEAGLVLMTLFLEVEEISVFQNFIVTDPTAVGLVISLIENDNFPQEKVNKKLHFSFTFLDDPVNIKFVSTINEQVYPWLKFKSVEYPNFTYETAYPTAFKDGIKFIFED